MTTTAHESELVPVDDLTPHPRNYREHPAEQIKHIAASITEHGFYRNVVATEDGVLLAGHGAVEAARSVGMESVPVVRVAFAADSPEALKILAADNTLALFAEDDRGALAEILGEVDDGAGLIGTGFGDTKAIEELLAAAVDTERRKGSDTGGTGITLAQRYIAPPLTVIRTYSGEWQSRKTEWLEAFPSMAGHEGRDEELAYTTNRYEYFNEMPSTSVFDPVLAEILTRWFSDTGDRVLDPFAGGPVRAVVNAELGRHYTGGEIRQEQIDFNRAAVEGHEFSGTAEWVMADATEPVVVDEPYDLVLTCPPYGDLEQYSGKHSGTDISALPDDEFGDAYRMAVSNALEALGEDRFACFVVGAYRPKRKDRLRCMIAPTTEAAESVDGVELYNSAVLATAVSTAAQRAAAVFPQKKKLTAVHQNILVYVKGDAKAASQRCEDLGEAAFFLPDEGVE